jgi:hypothetical protein
MNQLGSVANIERPSARVSFWEALVSRHILFPMACTTLNWEHAQRELKEESDIILRLVKPLNDTRLTKRIFVPRINGIEEEARFWSITMVLEHLIAVGERISNVIIALSHHESINGKGNIDGLKIEQKLAPSMFVQSFEEFTPRYLARLQQEVKDRSSPLFYHHKFFGNLNLRQWNTLAAVHLREHRRQIEEIIKLL